MWLIDVAILLAGGLLGAANLIIVRKPGAKALIDKLAPFSGAIGGLMFVWGVWDAVHALLWMRLLSFWPIAWIVELFLPSVTMLILGFLLGYGLITKYALSKSPEAMKKGEEVRLKLAKFQGPLGLIAIVVGILILLASIGILHF